MKVKGSDLKIMELTVSCDMFGELLILCIEHGMDLKYALSFPILPIPLMLGRINGTMHHTDKAALVHELEKYTRELQYEYDPDLVIIDFMFLLRCEAGNLPKTYSNVARHIMKKVCSFKAKTIIMVCDVYPEQPTIKDMCHEDRGDIGDSLGNSIGRGQTRPKDFNNALSSTKFKRMLIGFLIEEFTSCGDLIVDKEVSFAHAKCYSYLVRYCIQPLHSHLILFLLLENKLQTKPVHLECPVESIMKKS